jgi:flagellar protein FliS
MHRGLTTYQKAQTEGLSQRDLIVMCYKGAIRYLTEAKDRHQKNDFDGFSELLEKAHRVIFHLYTTLDMDRGGEIADRLADLYAFLISQLYLVNATKDVDIVDKLIGILSTLRDGWVGLDLTTVPQEQTAQQRGKPKSQKIVSVEI